MTPSLSPKPSVVHECFLLYLGLHYTRTTLARASDDAAEVVICAQAVIEVGQVQDEPRSFVDRVSLTPTTSIKGPYREYHLNTVQVQGLF